MPGVHLLGNGVFKSMLLWKLVGGWECESDEFGANCQRMRHALYWEPT